MPLVFSLPASETAIPVYDDVIRRWGRDVISSV